MLRGTGKLIIAISALFLIVVANGLFFDGALNHWAANHTSGVLVPLTQPLVRGREFFRSLGSRLDSAEEYAQLQEAREQLTVYKMQLEAAERDVVFYKDAAGIRSKTRAQLIEGSLFSYPREGGLSEAALNRGSADGIVSGSIAVTAGGSLIGQVTMVYEHHAIVRTIQDVGFEVTGRIADSAVSGLVRSNTEGLVLDLVAREEQVREGQVVGTSGNDRFPEGFIIGTVRSVDVQQATLFSLIRLNPAVTLPYAGRVIVVLP
jgi:rod shape-determining protein MreC